VPAHDLLQDVRVAPSILASDFARLGEQVEAVMDAGARVIHVDVMDGHFVPPITIGPLVVSALADQVHSAGGVLDVHLMIERPEHQVAEFGRAGADNITVHAEATPHLNYAVNAVRDAGCRAGVAICPATPVEMLDGVADIVDVALCMSVNPGWGGQEFIPSSLPKLRQMRARMPGHVLLEVDGGVHAGTAAQVVEAGATLLVAGSAVFESGDPAAAYRDLMEAAGTRSADSSAAAAE
jgi:ribulose-phosphate 3-epimerase